MKLFASFHHHMWIQTRVTVRKRLSWVLTSVTLTFDLWPWPFAWTSLLSLVITPGNFMMIRWWEHGEKGVTDGRTDRRTDGRTDWTSHIAAWSQLKSWLPHSFTRIYDIAHAKCDVLAFPDNDFQQPATFRYRGTIHCASLSRNNSAHKAWTLLDSTTTFWTFWLSEITSYTITNDGFWATFGIYVRPRWPSNVNFEGQAPLDSSYITNRFNYNIHIFGVNGSYTTHQWTVNIKTSLQYRKNSRKYNLHIIIPSSRTYSEYCYIFYICQLVSNAGRKKEINISVILGP